MADKQCDKDDLVKFCRKQRSVVWKHFERKNKHSVCKHCGKTFVYRGGMSNFCSHLKNAHQSLWPASDKDETTERTTASTQRIDTYVVSDSRKVCSSTKSEAITSLVIDWISANSRPISAVVEDTGLRQLFGYIEPAYSLPSCTQVTSIVKNVMQVARKV